MNTRRPPRSARAPRPGRARIWPIFMIAAFIAGGGGGFWAALRWTDAAPTSGISEAGGDDAEQLYTCGMHPNVIQNGPGDCPICHMKLTPLKQSDDEGGSAAGGPKERKVLYWRAPMDPNYVSDMPGKSPMGMDLVPVYADESQSATGKTIKIDPVTVQNMGIRTTTVQRGPLVKTVRTVGRVDYDEQTVTFIDTKFDGWIEKLHVDETGVQVNKGDPLFEVYSPKLYAAQEEYLAALRGVERLAESTIPEAREQTRLLVEAAEVQLRYFDVSDQQIDELRQTKEISKTLTIHSPAGGIVTEKMALGGMYVKPGMRLFTIADLSRVWAFVDIYEYQLPWVRVGQDARMSLPYVPDREFVGRVVYIYPYLEKQTRVVKVRLEFENPSLALKPGMYANVMLRADLDRHALLIPREAYIDSGTRQVAFVALDGGKFQPRDIQVGVEAEDGMVEVRHGLDEGERVVTSGQFMLDAESKLKEAIAKMLESQRAPSAATAEHEHDMAGVSTAVGGIPADAKYACPMDTHPDQADPAEQGAYFSAQAERCPWCGMMLQPLDELDWARARRAAGESEVAYTCPDHPHVYSDQSGACPRCGRELEPFKLMYTCPDLAHGGVISSHGGTCPHCGRELTPYRGIWLSPELADGNVPPKPAVAEGAAYRCPVHPLAHSDRPGKCPICARQLDATGAVAARPASQPTTPAGAEFVCPMHPDQHAPDARGTCPVCGMRVVAADAVPRPTSAPAAVAAQMNYLMEHYLALQQRFASDRTADVALHALGLIGAADAILARLDEPDVALPAEFGPAVRKLRAAAVKTTGKDLEADRVTFIELGAALRALVEHVRPDKQLYPKIYIFHCPMTKGDWLQDSEQMANPFYGFKMLKCGEPRGTK